MKIKSRYVLDRDDIGRLADLIDSFMAACPNEAGFYNCERFYGALVLLSESMCSDDGIIIDGNSVNVEHGVMKE